MPICCSSCPNCRSGKNLRYRSEYRLKWICGSSVQQWSIAMNIDVTKTHEFKKHKHGSPLISCRIDPTGKSIYVGAQDSRVWRWDWETDKKVELSGHDSWVRGIAFAPKSVVLTAGFDGRLIWWPGEGETVKPIRKVQAHDGWNRAVAVHPDGQLAATCGNDLMVRLWDIESGEKVAEMKGHESHIYNVAFHPNGKDLVSGDLKSNLIHWDLETRKQKRTFKAESLYVYDKGFKADIGGIRSMEFSKDGTLLACSGITNVTNAFAGVGNPSIELIQWSDGKRKIQHLSKAKLRGVAWGVALHPTPMTIGVCGGGGGGYLLFWKFTDKTEQHQLKLPNSARDMCLAPNGTDVITAHSDGHIRIYRMTKKA